MATPAQQQLVDGLTRLLGALPGIEAAWLAGSLGRGAGDAFSDVDLLVLVDSGGADAASAAIAAAIEADRAPVLLNRLFGGRVLNVVTEAWQRFDVSIVEPDDLSRYDATKLTPLFNHGERAPPAPPAIPYRTAPAALTALVNEFLRVLGLCPVVVGRGEHLLALTGIDQLRRMTIDLMLEENGIGPADRGGALSRLPLLTAEQREALAALPPLAATRESVIAGHIALARIFLPRAHRLAGEIAMPWPTRFEAATRRHW